jgi:hypothetical protein
MAGCFYSQSFNSWLSEAVFGQPFPIQFVMSGVNHELIAYVSQTNEYLLSSGL